MMKSSIMFISLLLVTIFFHEARGARLVSARLLTPKGAYLSINFHEFVGNSKSTNFEVEDWNLGKESTGSLLGSGRIRKLMTKTSASCSTAHSENIDKNDHENGNAVQTNTEQAEVHSSIKQSGNADDDDYKLVETLSVHSSMPPTSEQQQHQHDLQLLDVDEMDYSPARRKPPIHN